MHILLVDDDESIRLVIRHQLTEAGYQVTALADGSKVLRTVQATSFDIALLDNSLPDTSGKELLLLIKEHSPDTVVMLITAYATVELAVELMKKGAFDFLTKPVKEKDLLCALYKAEEFVKLTQENKTLKAQLRNALFSETFKSDSPSFNSVLKQAKAVAPTDASILITGETGTGKEHLSHDIHTLSNRKERAFVTINCGAIPEQLLESELFGFAKGAFTGAEKEKKGKIEAADGGTLFLDEIGELPLSMQAKLLRFLQEKTIERIGELKPRTVDTRIVAATNKELLQECKKGRFREDLYYRLAVIPLHLPPLRERREDIPLLLHFFLKHFSAKHRKNIVGFSPQVHKALAENRWQGNIREMKNLVERLVLLHGKTESIEITELPEQYKADTTEKLSPGHLPEEKPIATSASSLKEMEIHAITEALKESGGNKSKAARFLGITRNTLLYRMAKYKLKPAFTKQEG